MRAGPSDPTEAAPMDRPRCPAPAAPALPAAPLYDPRFEHDACGVAFVAETGRARQRSERVVPLALEALASIAVG